MKLHLTFPGRAGDLLWALPSMRAISEARDGEPLDLSICGEFKTIIPLLKAGAPYLGEITAHDHWRLVPPREWDAPLEPREGVRYLHLGYRGWPHTDLPHCVYEQIQREYPDIPLAPLDLERPWLTIDGPGAPCEIAVGWTETYFELKYGLSCLLTDFPTPMLILPPVGSRWDRERRPGHIAVDPCEWLSAARAIRNADLFLGDCSALHVLALAIGRPAVIVEPIADRLNPIFWPFGQDGPRVTLVRGLDGQATHDARHCAEALQRVLSALQRPSGARS